MTDKAKGNVLFVVALVMLVLTTMLHGGLQVLSGITGGLLAVVSLYYELKIRLKNIVSFFKGR
ncbi:MULTISPECIES: hypothetical protein [Enterococcus]|uniref:hypothetical protein n=1 Tax=Enterococcus TaxID=1350 RepID=UPI001BCC72BF|nr:hypothetical protein [Enterococcus gallinarum]